MCPTMDLRTPHHTKLLQLSHAADALSNSTKRFVPMLLAAQFAPMKIRMKKKIIIQDGKKKKSKTGKKEGGGKSQTKGSVAVLTAAPFLHTPVLPAAFWQ